MAAEQQTSGAGLDRLLSLGKDLFALLRDFSLFALAVLLILFPRQLNETLTAAGFEEGSVVGFKWKARLLDTDEALRAAQGTIESLQAQLKQANEALAAAGDAVPAGNLRDTIQKAEKTGRETAASSKSTVDVVQSAISANAPLVERAEASLYPTTEWWVVFGSDRTMESAQYEIKKAARNGIDTTSIYFRNGYYASIASAETREKAEQYLKVIRTFRQDAYIARSASWCKNPISRDGYVECAPTN